MVHCWNPVNFKITGNKINHESGINTLLDTYIIVIRRHILLSLFRYVYIMMLLFYTPIIVIICMLAVYRQNNWDAGETSETYFSGKKTTGDILIHSCSFIMC